nr:APOBEC1 complementation factor [Mirounga angustirostris]
MESNHKSGDGLSGTQKEAALRALIQRTGYSLVQENGQRKYGGPPPGWDAAPPERGCEIFIGKLPRDLFEDELIPLCEKIGKIYEMRMMMDFNGNNRGYAFVTFSNKQEAKDAIKQLNNYEISGRVNVFMHDPFAYRSASLKDIPQGAVERVKKIRDYAFVHFSNREDAVEAMKALNGKVLDGSPIEVTLAKPVDKDSYVRYTRGTGGRGTMLQGEYTYSLGHVYDPTTTYLGAPVFYAPQAYTAIPSLHFPATKGHLGNRAIIRAPSVREIYMNVPVGAAGVRGLAGRGYLAYTGLGRGYQVKGDKREDKLYDLLPGMELTPMNPVTLKPQGIKLAPQILEEICQKNNWGQPVYQLHSAIGQDQRQLFLYKITIPALASQNPAIHPFTPPKLSAYVDEAKTYAAEYTLQTLGIPTDGADAPTTATASTAFPGYAVPSATAPMSTAQLKQAVTLGQDLAAYTTYEVYPTFAVTARGDGYGAF